MSFLFMGLLHHSRSSLFLYIKQAPSGSVASFSHLIDEFISNVKFFNVNISCDCVCLFVFFLLRYISYPRTETNIFPANLALGPLVEQQTQSPDWGAFAQRVLEQPGGPKPRQGKKSDQAHPPIHPTKYSGTLQVGLQKLELSLCNRSFCFNSDY